MYNSRIIIACDFPNKAMLMAFLEKFAGKKLFLKLGMELLYSEGFGLIAELKLLGHNIFVDLKIHDIPHTAKQAIKSLLKYEPDFITAHALGGLKMLSLVQQEVASTKTKILGVTVLTSHDATDLKSLNINVDVATEVSALMDLLIKANITHVICSAQEAKLAKTKGLISITPGIRFASDQNDDQIRVVTPSEAFKHGSDFIVVGRSLTEASNPLERYRTIEKEF